MTGGTGQLRNEGVATLGARCRTKARRRMALVSTLMAGAAVLTWLVLPTGRRPEARGTMPG